MNDLCLMVCISSFLAYCTRDFQGDKVPSKYTKEFLGLFYDIWMSLILFRAIFKKKMNLGVREWYIWHLFSYKV